MQTLTFQNGLSLQLIKFILHFTLVCAAREYNKACITNIIDRCIYHLRVNKEASNWLLEAFCQQCYLREFLQESPISMQNVRKYVVALIEAAYKQCPNERLIEAVLIFLGTITKNFADLFDLIKRLVHVTPELFLKR